MPAPHGPDALQLVRWSLNGITYGLREGYLKEVLGTLAGFGFVFAAAAAAGAVWAGLAGAAAGVLAVPILIVAIALGVYLDLGRSRTWYGGPSIGAVLAIRRSWFRGKPTWTIGEHVSARPGEGCGQALRDSIRVPLLAAADAAGVTIACIAASQKLAIRYREEIPDLEDVGRAFPRGRRLERAPRIAARRSGVL